MSKLSKIRQILSGLEAYEVEYDIKNMSPYSNSTYVQEVLITIHLDSSFDTADKVNSCTVQLEDNIGHASHRSLVSIARKTFISSLTYIEPVVSKMVTVHPLDESDTDLPEFSPANNQYVQLLRNIRILILPSETVSEELKRSFLAISRLRDGRSVDPRVLNFLS